MRLLTFLIFGALLNALPLLARDKADVLVMNNGDRFTCEIKGLDSGVLYIGLDYIQGTVQVDWSKVSRVESKQLFLVKTEDGHFHMGSLSMAEGDAARTLHIEIVEDPANTVLVSQKDVVGINQTSEDVWRRFNGAINAGFTYSKANSTTQYSFGTSAQYIRERWSSGSTYNSTLTGNTGVETSTRNNVSAYYRHLMRWDKWFYTGIGSLLQSTEQNIQLQSVLGGGIGRSVNSTNRSTIDVFGGIAYQNTRYSKIGTQPPSQNTAAAMIGVDAALFKFDKTKLTLSAMAVPAMNQPGRIYSNINTSYYLKFWGNFTWNLSFYGNWDNQPPAGFAGSDYGTTSGIGWTFGNYNTYNR